MAFFRCKKPNFALQEMKICAAGFEKSRCAKKKIPLRSFQKARLVTPKRGFATSFFLEGKKNRTRLCKFFSFYIVLS